MNGWDKMEIYVILTIVGMFVVTYIPRALPFFTKVDVDRYKFLGFVPVAIFASLALPDTILFNNKLTIDRIVAGTTAVLVAYKTRKMFLTIFLSLIVLFIFKSLF
jgi:branched-subunit amino acid transport protein